MQTVSLPTQIQAVMPMMAQLSLEQRAYIAQFVLSTAQIQPTTSRLGADTLGVVYVSDDFDDELGDEFWLGQD